MTFRKVRPGKVERSGQSQAGRLPWTESSRDHIRGWLNVLLLRWPFLTKHLRKSQQWSLNAAEPGTVCSVSTEPAEPPARLWQKVFTPTFKRLHFLCILMSRDWTELCGELSHSSKALDLELLQPGTILNDLNQRGPQQQESFVRTEPMNEVHQELMLHKYS